MKYQKFIQWSIWLIQFVLVVICIWIIGCGEPECPPHSEDKNLSCPDGFRALRAVGQPYPKCQTYSVEGTTACCMHSCLDYVCVDETGAEGGITNDCTPGIPHPNSRCSTDGSHCEE